METIFWTGPRESDIAYTGNMFQASATFYGSNEGSNVSFCDGSFQRINHNEFNQDASDFILQWQLEMIRNNPDCKFMSYNPNCVFGAPSEILSRTVCLNEEALMKSLDNKLEFRKIASGIVPLLSMLLCKGSECSYEQLVLHPSFSGYTEFIIQELVSSGGQGTYLLDKNNASVISQNLVPEHKYIVTGYLPQNIPVNIHAIIYDDGIQLLPASIQIIQPGNKRLLYRGADFIAYNTIAPELQHLFFDLSSSLCKKLQTLGYRGILGLDALIADDKIYFLEVNNRFQGSSILINKALATHNFPSLQEMNLRAFCGMPLEQSIKEALQTLPVPYSLYTFIHEPGNKHSNYLYYALTNEKSVSEIISEGYVPGQNVAPYATQYAAIFTENILSLCEKDHAVRLHPNISGSSAIWNNRISSGDLTAVKTAVINQGAVMTPEAKQFVATHGKMRIGTYFSLDLFIQGAYINCPLYIKLTALSPFEIDVAPSSPSLCLKYYGQVLFNVSYDTHTYFPESLIQDTPLEQICFFATDRLRLQNSPTCTFVQKDAACRFCEAVGIHNEFSKDDILNAIDTIFTSNTCPPFRHILIGGLSNDLGKERDVIIAMCHRIRNYTDMPIYLMSLPPSIEDIKAYVDAGITEFGFNIEIYDRELARKYMPAKGKISLNHYLSALSEATTHVGKAGAVRSAFIVGLEPIETLLKGIEKLCSLGVAPILSVFRPIPGTELSNIIPPSSEELFHLLEKAEEICQQYTLSLGPTCPACRNNTLSFVQPNEVEKIYSEIWMREP